MVMALLLFALCLGPTLKISLTCLRYCVLLLMVLPFVFVEVAVSFVDDVSLCVVAGGGQAGDDVAAVHAVLESHCDQQRFCVAVCCR